MAASPNSSSRDGSVQSSSTMVSSHPTESIGTKRYPTLESAPVDVKQTFGGARPVNECPDGATQLPSDGFPPIAGHLKLGFHTCAPVPVSLCTVWCDATLQVIVITPTKAAATRGVDSVVPSWVLGSRQRFDAVMALGTEPFLVFADGHDDLSTIRLSRAFGHFGRISRMLSG